MLEGCSADGCSTLARSRVLLAMVLGMEYFCVCKFWTVHKAAIWDCGRSLQFCANKYTRLHHTHSTIMLTALYAPLCFAASCLFKPVPFAFPGLATVMQGLLDLLELFEAVLVGLRGRPAHGTCLHEPVLIIMSILLPSHPVARGSATNATDQGRRMRPRVIIAQRRNHPKYVPAGSSLKHSCCFIQDGELRNDFEWLFLDDAIPWLKTCLLQQLPHCRKISLGILDNGGPKPDIMCVLLTRRQ